MKRTAAILLALLTLAAPAHAWIVSKEVGPLLIEVRWLMTSGKYDAAMAKLNEAEALKSSPDAAAANNSMRQYLYVKSGSVQPLPEKTQPSHGEN